MARHTNGPWRFVGKFGAGWLVDPNIAVVYGGKPTGHDVDGESNARLIAASPRMYDFIKHLADEGDADAAALIAAI